MPQESAQKIPSLSFKTVTYCARIRLPRVRISLILRDARLNTAIQMNVMPTLKRRAKRIPTSERCTRFVALILMNL